MPGFDRLQSEVIGAGLCTDCGMCAGVCPRGSITMDCDLEEPALTGKCHPRCQVCYLSCAGKDIPVPSMERMVFGRERDPSRELLGICREFRKGQSTEERVRIAGATGGLISGLLIYALESGLIDAAVVVGMREDQPWRAAPMLATNKEEVMAAGQSKLQMVPANSVLGDALRRGFQKLAVVGLPCHIHSLRKMQLVGNDKKLARSVKYVIGLLCGGNWTHKATEHVIDEVCGVSLDEVAKVEYRGGEYPGNFRVTTKDGRQVAVTSPVRRNHCWGFRHDRCGVCFDYSNDLADLSVGDYHHAEMVRGVPGWSAFILRTDTGLELVEAAQATGYVTTETIEEEYLLTGAYEWKIHGSSYHLEERRRHGLPCPDFHLPLTPGPLRRMLPYDHPHFKG